jgi:hypothetical protein
MSNEISLLDHDNTIIYPKHECGLLFLTTFWDDTRLYHNLDYLGIYTHEWPPIRGFTLKCPSYLTAFVNSDAVSSLSRGHGCQLSPRLQTCSLSRFYTYRVFKVRCNAEAAGDALQSADLRGVLVIRAGNRAGGATAIPCGLESWSAPWPFSFTLFA